MTASGYLFQIDVADTAESLQAALDDPERRWYARKRLAALAVTGGLLAAGWTEHMHPRGRDGKFIEKFGFVRWLDNQTMNWRSGWVEDIDPHTGELTIRSGGESHKFPSAAHLYARPRRKAQLNLPDVLGKITPKGWVKSGGQGGSNPGGMFTVDAHLTFDSPDLGPNSGLPNVMHQISKGNTAPIPQTLDATPEKFIPDEFNVVTVPRLDGTKARSDVLYRMGTEWYRVPANGPMTADDQLRPDLKVNAEEAFGAPGSERRKAVLADNWARNATLSDEFDPDKMAAMVQGIGAPLPKAGEKYYVKTMDIPERARNEAFANHLYELLGVPVPIVSLGADGRTVSSRLIGEKVPFDPHNAQHRAAAKEGFVADAFLSNWDVIGAVYDNIQIDPDGRAWRIDAGGALAYRAKGEPKGSKFGGEVGELTSMRSGLNPNSNTVFGDITLAEMQQQGEALQAIEPYELQDLANEFGLPEIGPILIARRKSVLDQLGLPSEPPPPQLPEHPVSSNPETYYGTFTYPDPKVEGLPHVAEVSTPAQVADSNYGLTFASLPTTSWNEVAVGQDVVTPSMIETFARNAVFVRNDGDLYTYQSKFHYDPYDNAVFMKARNLFTGQIHTITVRGDDPSLTDYEVGDPSLDNLVDDLAIARQLAIDEIVTKAKGDSIESMMVAPTKYTPVAALETYEMGVPNWEQFTLAFVDGNLGPTGKEGASAWPLMSGEDNSLWEITSIAQDGVKMRRRDVPDWVEVTLTPQAFDDVGAWLRPGNDTTAALWKDRYYDADPDEIVTVDWAGNPMTKAELDEFNNVEHHKLQQQILDHQHQDPDYTPDLPPTEKPVDNGNLPVDVDGAPDIHELDAQADAALADWHAKQMQNVGITPDSPDDGFPQPGDMNLNDDQSISKWDGEKWVPMQEHSATQPGVYDDPLQALLAEQEHVANVHAAVPTYSQKIVNGVVAGLGPGDHIVMSELDVADHETLSAKWIGKNVAVVPAEALDPDWDGNTTSDAYDISYGNGLGVVTAVELKKHIWVSGHYTANKHVPGGYFDQILIRVKKPDGSELVLTSTRYDKILVEVSAEPILQPVQFKKDGSGAIMINGVQVGTWQPKPGYYGGWKGVLDADHSITGKAVEFSEYKMKDGKATVAAFVIPIPPKIVKKKNVKTIVTEQELKDLNTNLASLQAEIALTEFQLTIPAPIGEGVPLNDGHIPSKGDWVFSTKDGTYMQVVNLGTGNDPPDTIRVKFTKPDGTVIGSTRRKRADLVSIAEPGSYPFTLETKAVKDVDDEWVGPGSHVFVAGASKGVVLDTTTDGLIKVKLNSDGSIQWKKKDEIGVSYSHGGPSIVKPLPGKAKADDLNAHLATLQDSATVLALQIANSKVGVPKPKKEVGTPYPGPGGKTVKQPVSWAEKRTAAGLKNMKDGYAPAVGQIVRDTDGSQWAVMDVGKSYQSTRKNSVKLLPMNAGVVDPYANAKWRTISMLVVDHNASLTDEYGFALPIVDEIIGVDWAPSSGVIWRRDYETGYWTKADAATGKKAEWRNKKLSKFYVVAPEGTIYNLNGNQVYYASQELAGAKPVGYLDHEHVGAPASKMSVSIQSQPGNIGQTYYAVIHDPTTTAGEVLAGPPKITTEDEDFIKDVLDAQDAATEDWVNGPQLPPSYYSQEKLDEAIAQGWLYNGTEWTQTGKGWPTEPTVHQIAEATFGEPETVTPAAPEPEPEPLPPPPLPAPVIPSGMLPPGVVAQPTPMDEMVPVFTGKNPMGMESEHPATVSSSASVPVFKPTGGTNLDVAGLPEARSVVSAVAETQAKATANKKSGNKTWIGTYALADHDTIEDMMVQTQVVKDAQGNEYVEVRFRLEQEAARKAHTTFMTSTTNEVGDWEFANRNAKNLVPGDLLAVKVSQGGDQTLAGALKPDGLPNETGKMPNARVIAAPVLIGKNKKGTYDIWRTQVLTAGGEIGFIDMEDRDDKDTVVTAYWDATKPRTSTGAKGLNPNAKADGWSVKYAALDYQHGGKNTDHTDQAGIYQLKDSHKTSVHNYGNHSSLPGHTLQRDYDGVHIEYKTSHAMNSADGMVVIRVPVDDPDAQRKISEAMEIVGVSKEAQQPPDSAALITLATNAVWTQFNHTYTRGAKPNSPQEALDAIDKAVGKNMPLDPTTGLPRKARMDDITLRFGDDGLMQVLVSEDVARAVGKTNGVKAYQHAFDSDSFRAAIIGAMKETSPGLLATTERWAHGLFYFGMSSEGDFKQEAADHLFLRMSDMTSSTHQHMLIIDPITIHRQVDYYFQYHDSWGARQSHQTNFLDHHTGGGNELMLQRRIEADTWGHVILSGHERSSIIQELHKAGVTHAPNGMKIEDFLVEKGGSNFLPPTPPSMGVEYPLTALPTTPLPGIPTGTLVP